MSEPLPPPTTAPLQGPGSPVYYQPPSATDSGEFDWSDSRWGIPDILLGVLVVLVTAFVSSIMGVAAAGGFSVDGPSTESLESEFVVVVCSLLGLQGSLMAWPIIVAKWKGRGVVNDFGFRFRWIDLAIGPAVAVVMLVTSAIVGFVSAKLVGLDDASEASNTDLLTGGSGGLARVVLVLFVVLGAPLSEELFFRGLSMRAIQKRAGKPLALFVSTLLFAGPHFQGGSWQAVVVLLSSIGVIGLMLGLLGLVTGRLGPGIVAHACFNGIVVLVTLNLEALEGLEGMIRIGSFGLWY